MIWSKPLPDGTTLCVEDVLLPLKGYRDGRQYMVVLCPRDGKSRCGICKVDEGGHPIIWYVNSETQAQWAEVMKDLPSALMIEQVMEI